MTFDIRNPNTIDAPITKEAPTETARRILARRGLSFPKNRPPVRDDAYHNLDHDFGKRAIR